MYLALSSAIFREPNDPYWPMVRTPSDRVPLENISSTKMAAHSRQNYLSSWTESVTKVDAECTPRLCIDHHIGSMPVSNPQNVMTDTLNGIRTNKLVPQREERFRWTTQLQKSSPAKQEVRWITFIEIIHFLKKLFITKELLLKCLK